MIIHAHLGVSWADVEISILCAAFLFQLLSCFYCAPSEHSFQADFGWNCDSPTDVSLDVTSLGVALYHNIMKVEHGCV